MNTGPAVKIADELETLLRRIVREELSKLLGIVADTDASDDELLAQARERAAAMRRSRGGK